MQIETGDMVAVDIGHRTLMGMVVEIDDDSKYLTIKHDNFKGELFEKKQVTQVITKEEQNLLFNTQ